MGRQTVRNGHWHRKTDDAFQSEMREIHPDILPLETFQSSHIPVLCRCLKCGYEWKAEPANLTFRKSPTGCPVCSGTKKKTTEEFRLEMAQKHPDIEILGEYVDSHTAIQCKCLKHNCIYYAVPTNLSRRLRNGCRACYDEHGESAVASQLKQYCLQHFPGAITEYRIAVNPVTGRYLPFDIFIPNYKGRGTDIYCEIMGLQHYKRTPYWQKSDADFEKSVARDIYKEAYAKAHGRYVEIDLRDVASIEDALALLDNEPSSWIAQWAYQVRTDDSIPGAAAYITEAYASEM